MVEKTVVRGIGTLAILGGIAFFFVGIGAIAWYLVVAGVVFWVSSLGWRARYLKVEETAPEGYRPTGEVYENPGGKGPVAVYFKGIRRVYVRQSQG